MTTNDKQMFIDIEKKFRQKMRDAVAELRAEEIQDWSRIEKMALQYAGFLELFPEAASAAATADEIAPIKQPRKAKKATAKKAVAKKATAPAKA